MRDHTEVRIRDIGSVIESVNDQGTGTAMLNIGPQSEAEAKAQGAVSDLALPIIFAACVVIACAWWCVGRWLEERDVNNE